MSTSRTMLAVLAAVFLRLGVTIGGGAVIIAHESDHPTRDWAVAKYGTFDAFEVSGSGDESFELPAGARAGALTGQHIGNEDFEIGQRSPYDRDRVSPVFSAEGNYFGTTAFGLVYSTGSEFVVEADGDWEISIEPIAQAPFLEETGHGDENDLELREHAPTEWTITGAPSVIVIETDDEWSFESS